jgi:hypothetical protein
LRHAAARTATAHVVAQARMLGGVVGGCIQPPGASASSASSTGVTAATSCDSPRGAGVGRAGGHPARALCVHHHHHPGRVVIQCSSLTGGVDDHPKAGSRRCSCCICAVLSSSSSRPSSVCRCTVLLPLRATAATMLGFERIHKCYSPARWLALSWRTLESKGATRALPHILDSVTWQQV